MGQGECKMCHLKGSVVKDKRDEYEGLCESCTKQEKEEHYREKRAVERKKEEEKRKEDAYQRALERKKEEEKIKEDARQSQLEHARQQEEIKIAMKQKGYELDREEQKKKMLILEEKSKVEEKSELLRKQTALNDLELQKKKELQKVQLEKESYETQIGMESKKKERDLEIQRKSEELERNKRKDEIELKEQEKQSQLNAMKDEAELHFHTAVKNDEIRHRNIEADYKQKMKDIEIKREQNEADLRDTEINMKKREAEQDIKFREQEREKEIKFREQDREQENKFREQDRELDNKYRKCKEQQNLKQEKIAHKVDMKIKEEEAKTDMEIKWFAAQQRADMEREFAGRMQASITAGGTQIQLTGGCVQNPAIADLIARLGMTPKTLEEPQKPPATCTIVEEEASVPADETIQKPLAPIEAVIHKPELENQCEASTLQGYSLPVIKNYYRHLNMMDAPALSFVHPVGVITLTSEEMTFKNDREDISIHIPQGTLPVGSRMHVEVGSAMYGPFSFPPNMRPVSPILWICPQEDSGLCKPLKITLPHTVKYEDDTDLTFMKANHNNFSVADNGYKMFKFEEMTQYEIIEFDEKCGSVYTTKFCSICIARNITKPTIYRYWLSCIKRYKTKLLTSFELEYCAAYSLGTCMEALQKTCKKKDLHSCGYFTFGPDGKIKLQMTKDCSTSNWIVAIRNSAEIEEKEIDFWAQRYNQYTLEMHQRVGLYPPRITVCCDGSEANRACELTLCFSGASKDLMDKVILPSPSRPKSGYTTVWKPCEGGMQTPTQQDLMDNVTTTQWYRLGLELTGNDITMNIIDADTALTRISDKTKEMFRVWLRECDEPTWWAVVDALKNIREKRLSRKIKKKFC